MRRAQDLQVQQVVHCHIHRVTGFSRDNRGAERISQASPTSLSGDILFCGFSAVKGLVDAAVTGAAAKVALQMERKVLLLLLRETGGGHDHPRTAKTALE